MEWAWSPLGISILWVVLHSADYLLTITAARMYGQGDLRSRIDMGGRSLELNPVFQRAVNRGAWVSRRFLVTLLAGAAVLFAVCILFGALPVEEVDSLAWAPELLAGVLVVTRVNVICGHVQTLALFHRVLRHPEAAEVRVRYDRGTVFTAKRWSYLQPAALCALAYLVTPSTFFAGGALGMATLAAMTLIWQRKEAGRGAAAEATRPAGAAARQPPQGTA
jgi:hypothetical protein